VDRCQQERLYAALRDIVITEVCLELKPPACGQYAGPREMITTQMVSLLRGIVDTEIWFAAPRDMIATQILYAAPRGRLGCKKQAVVMWTVVSRRGMYVTLRDVVNTGVCLQLKPPACGSMPDQER
jgi:hypothetical protein